MSTGLLDLPVELIDGIFRDSPDLDRHLLSLTCSVLRAKYRLHIDYSTVLCRDAAHSGYVDLFRWAALAGYACREPDNPESDGPCNLMDAAAASGSIPMIECVREFGWEWTEKTIEKASKSRNIDTLAWLLDNGCTMDLVSYMAAARRGYLDVIKWLHARTGITPATYVVGVAAIGGHIDVVEWCLDGKTPTQSIVEYAAAGGHIHMVKWLLRAGATLSAEVFGRASCSNLEMVKWLRQKRCLYDKWGALKEAIKYNKLDIFTWLCENLPGLCNRASRYAAKYGRLEMCRILHRHGSVLIGRDCLRAIEYGHSKIADWAFKQCVCIMDVGDISAMICWGQLRAIQWLHLNGYLRGYDVCDEALIENKIEIMEWALSVGYPSRPNVYHRAASSGDIETVGRYYAFGAPLDASVMTEAAKSGNIELIEWLVSVGCSGTWHVYRAAVSANKLDVVKYAWSHGWTYNCSVRYAAVELERHEIVRWIDENIPADYIPPECL